MSMRGFAAGGAFAHLLGKDKTAAKARADDDETDEERRERERKERDEAKASAEDDADDSDGKGKKSKASKSKADREDDDMDDADEKRKEDEDDEEHDPDEVGDSDPKGKKAKRAKAKAADDEDDARASGVKAERARVRAILGSAAAGARPDVAAHLACNTDLSAKAAIDTLDAIAAGALPSAIASRRAGIADRMASTPNPDVGQEDQRPEPRKASLGDRVAALQKKFGAA